MTRFRALNLSVPQSNHFVAVRFHECSVANWR
jgi:hypothetical protein